MANIDLEDTKKALNKSLLTNLRNFKKDILDNAYQPLNPFYSATYEGIIAKSNTNGNGADFMPITLTPKDGQLGWSIKFTISGSVKNGTTVYDQSADVELYGNGKTITAYKNFNYIKNTTYRPFYDVVAYAPATAGNDMVLGFNLYNTWNNTNASYARTIKIDITSFTGCTIQLRDTVANTDYTTYYTNLKMSGRSTYNTHDTGLQETGDNNTGTYQYYEPNTKCFASYIHNDGVESYDTYGIYGYGLVMRNMPNAWGSLIGKSSYSTTACNRTKTGFYPDKIYYYSSGSAVKSGSLSGSNIFWLATDWVDFRPMIGCGQTLYANKPVFLKGIMVDGLFYPSNPCYSQDLPTKEDGCVYCRIGYTYSNYQGILNLLNPVWVEYREGKIREVNEIIVPESEESLIPSYKNVKTLSALRDATSTNGVSCAIFQIVSTEIFFLDETKEISFKYDSKTYSYPVKDLYALTFPSASDVTEYYTLSSVPQSDYENLSSVLPTTTKPIVVIESYATPLQELTIVLIYFGEKIHNHVDGDDTPVITDIFLPYMKKSYGYHLPEVYSPYYDKFQNYAFQLPNEQLKIDNDGNAIFKGDVTATDSEGNLISLDGINKIINGVTYATTSHSGLMSAADKTKLDGITAKATANTGTVTSVAVKANGSVKGTVTTSGTIDLGTIGTYSKPSGGIPSTDLALAVQSSLDKANSALQSHQDISGKANKATTLSGYGIADGAINQKLTNENLNNVTTPGFYNASGGNTVSNKPSGTDYFGLIVIHNASGAYYTQQLYTQSQTCIRYCVNGTWTAWSPVHSQHTDFLVVGQNDSNYSGENLTDTIEDIDYRLNTMQSNFQAGVDGIYNTLVAQGTTPSSKSLSDIKTGINTLANRSKTICLTCNTTYPAGEFEDLNLLRNLNARDISIIFAKDSIFQIYQLKNYTSGTFTHPLGNDINLVLSWDTTTYAMHQAMIKNTVREERSTNCIILFAINAPITDYSIADSSSSSSSSSSSGV